MSAEGGSSYARVSTFHNHTEYACAWEAEYIGNYDMSSTMSNPGSTEMVPLICPLKTGNSLGQLFTGLVSRIDSLCELLRDRVPVNLLVA